MRAVLRWFGRTFFGTSGRFWGTVAIATLVVAYWNPKILERALGNLIGVILGVIGPFLGPILVLAIALYGIRILLSGLKK